MTDSYRSITPKIGQMHAWKMKTKCMMDESDGGKPAQASIDIHVVPAGCKSTVSIPTTIQHHTTLICTKPYHIPIKFCPLLKTKRATPKIEPRDELPHGIDGDGTAST
jgi:hypothetical protein